MGTKDAGQTWCLASAGGVGLPGGRRRKIPVQTSLTFKGSESAASARLAAFVEQEKGHTPEGKLTVGQWCDQWLEHIRNHPDYSPRPCKAMSQPYGRSRPPASPTFACSTSRRRRHRHAGRDDDRGLKSGTLLNYKHSLRCSPVGGGPGSHPGQPGPAGRGQGEASAGRGSDQQATGAVDRRATKVDATGDAIRPPEMAHIIKMGAYLGCRRGELCALQWKDWDREGNRLRIDASAYNVQGGGGGTKSPKNGYRRWVSISEKVQAILWERLTTIEFLVDQGMWGLTRDDIDECYIFSVTAPVPVPRCFPPTSRGRHQNPASGGLPESIRFHDLRHWSASTAIAAGESFTAVSKRLGHSQVSTTMNITRMSLKVQDEAIAKALEDAV